LSKITFVIGGCRSGKSGFALDLAEKIPDSKRLFIATSVPKDDEMKARVARHQKERGPEWETIEAPIRLPEVILENSREGNVILVDCITLWLNNLLFEDDTPSAVDEKVNKLTRALSAIECPIIMVSNEVGAGIVPENALARRFRDIAGSVNQTLAACSHRVAWVVAGIPVFVKG